MKDKKKIAFKISLILMALYFSLFESFIPKPFPWIKLGFANIASLIAMEKLGIKAGIEVTVLRILISSIVLGTFMSPGFMISISSGLFSILIVASLFKYKRYFSIVSISTIGGLSHNLFQLIMVYIIFFRGIDILNKEILIFIEVFLVFGSLSGALVGFLAQKYRI